MMSARLLDANELASWEASFAEAYWTIAMSSWPANAVEARARISSNGLIMEAVKPFTRLDTSAWVGLPVVYAIF